MLVATAYLSSPGYLLFPVCPLALAVLHLPRGLPSSVLPNLLTPDLSSASSSWLVSTPSRSTRPALGSSSRKSTRNTEDLPEPVRPTMPSFSPGSTRKVTPSRAFGSPGRYTSSTSWNSTLPWVSQRMRWWGDCEKEVKEK